MDWWFKKKLYLIAFQTTWFFSFSKIMPSLNSRLQSFTQSRYTMRVGQRGRRALSFSWTLLPRCMERFDRREAAVYLCDREYTRHPNIWIYQYNPIAIAFLMANGGIICVHFLPLYFLLSMSIIKLVFQPLIIPNLWTILNNCKTVVRRCNRTFGFKNNHFPAYITKQHHRNKCYKTTTNKIHPHFWPLNSYPKTQFQAIKHVF